MLQIIFYIWGIPALIEIPIFIWQVIKEKELRIDDLLGAILFLASSYFGIIMWLIVAGVVYDDKVVWRRK